MAMQHRDGDRVSCVANLKTDVRRGMAGRDGPVAIVLAAGVSVVDQA
jgi:hypothetical protein